MEIIAILVVVNSIGIVPIISFFVTLWYKSKRHEELIKNLIATKATMKERADKTEKELSDAKNAILDLLEFKREIKAKIEAMQNRSERVSNTLVDVTSTLKHLDDTIKRLLDKVDAIKS